MNFLNLTAPVMYLYRVIPHIKPEKGTGYSRYVSFPTSFSQNTLSRANHAALARFSTLPKMSRTV
jgi:hypothetical protein